MSSMASTTTWIAAGTALSGITASCLSSNRSTSRPTSDAAVVAMSDDDMARCPAYQDGKHQPGEDFREWRRAKADGRPIACRCGHDVWPVCSICGKPEVGWQQHEHDQ